MTKKKATTELEKLQHRWLRKTGDDMPQNIAVLDIRIVRSAVLRTEAGETVFVPGATVMSETRNGYGCGDSMREWDGDSFH